MLLAANTELPRAVAHLADVIHRLDERTGESEREAVKIYVPQGLFYPSAHKHRAARQQMHVVVHSSHKRLRLHVEIRRESGTQPLRIKCEPIQSAHQELFVLTPETQLSSEDAKRLVRWLSTEYAARTLEIHTT